MTDGFIFSLYFLKQKIAPKQHEIAEEDRRTYRPKRFEYNNEDEDNNLSILSDKQYF